MTRLTNIYKAKIISNNNTFIDEDIEMKEQDDDCLRGPKKNKKELYYTMPQRLHPLPCQVSGGPR